MSLPPFDRTHEVLNQPPPLEDYDVLGLDFALRAAVEREGAGAALQALAKLGLKAGSAEALRWGTQANTHLPILRTHDRFGHRMDEVEYHPAYHALMATAVEHGLHVYPGAGAEPGAEVTRAAGFYLWSQVEQGHGCPISMTHAVIPSLRAEPRLAAVWEPLFTARSYDPVLRPIAERRSAIAGMAMTEKQGGSDVRANTTFAQPAPSAGEGAFTLTGHKWFCSAPMSDAFLMLAQAPAGLTCFLVPRVLEDGTRNALYLLRLKDKLGNRSNASAEIELRAALGFRVGEEGRGVRTIIEMVSSTRLDCVIGSAAIMRQALTQAIHHARHREAFGKRLAAQSLMQNVLADLALESEAATVLMMRLAGAADRAANNPLEARFKRIATPVGKYWVCKRTPPFTAEAAECLGGNGYVEESGLPRLYREAPVNSIWEGSGNVNALDVLRVAAKDPEAVEAFVAECERGRGANGALDRALTRLREAVGRAGSLEAGARGLLETMALTLQGSLLVRHAPAEVADAFCRSRLGGEWGQCFGTLPPELPLQALVERALPG